MSDNDFLVLYEGEDDGAEDEVVLDVDVHEHQVHRNIEAEFGASVTNHASGVAVAGLIVTIVGAVVCLGAAVLFMLNYPAAWYPQSAANEGLIQLVAALALGGIFLLILGNLLVGFGRQLRAEGILHSLRFVPEE